MQIQTNKCQLTEFIEIFIFINNAHYDPEEQRPFKLDVILLETQCKSEETKLG